MRVAELELEGFRNYESFYGEFSPGVNLIYGDNAQGKTNLLEAVGYLSGARSHRARGDRELIGFQRQEAAIRAAVESRGRMFRIEADLSRGKRRRLFSNQVRLKTAGELSQLLRTVLFCPEDLSLIRAGSGERRRFLDSCLCQMRPRYAAALAEYNRIYEHKTRILRDWEQKPALLDLLEDFNDRMARCGAILIHYRGSFVRRLAQCAGAIHADFSGGGEEMALSYATVKTVSDPAAPAKEIYPQLLEHQRSHRRAELEARMCLSGPHKDDLLVEIDGRGAKQFASQGQTRTAALSLKLAERELHRDDLGEWPVLLLDDVLSELDRRRQEFVLRRITGGQVFITCCDASGLEGVEGAAFHIKNGAFAG
ncbi:DNA replication/repair protein RecF [Pseudoflavonifractor sp. 524-17]|uniref:DNA replication/repair protein RecF n=1 Tax=Pseudoflavonifractor sp. 524-17 TaxID=2304577 RepID=UPI00137B5778|nr:DNA replication/repair protein RecF [Pseudoflavonifractor sp. 524-17]NCE63819.1 DNA replication/repair protein RecF [Pseudoflavonifractor sp. 524-17]